MSEDVVPWLLKILSGPQSGAELGLASERVYRIGAADDDDVVLRGDGILPDHAAVSVAGGQVRLAAVAGRVLLADGALEPGADRSLAAGTSADIGGIRVGLGPAETDWAALAAQRIEPRPEPAPPAAGPASAVGGPPAAAASPAAAAPRSPRWRRPAVIAAGVAAALIAVAAALWMLRPPPPSAPTLAEQLQQARQLIATSGCPKLEAHSMDGLPTLSGYCDTRADLSALTAALAAAGLSFDDRTRVLAEMKQQVTETLSRLDGGALGFHVADDGALTVSGFYDGDLPREELAGILRSDVAGISRVHLQIQTAADARQDLLKLVAASPLSGLVQVHLDQGTLVVSAVDGASITEAQWGQIAARFAQDRDGEPPLRADIEFAPEKVAAATHGAAAKAAPEAVAAAPQWHLTAVIMVTGKEPFAVLKDMGEVRVGDAVGGGYQVSEIQPEYIVVSSGADRQILRLRDYH